MPRKRSCVSCYFFCLLGEGEIFFSRISAGSSEFTSGWLKISTYLLNLGLFNKVFLHGEDVFAIGLNIGHIVHDVMDEK